MPWPALTRARQQYGVELSRSGKPGAPAAIDLHIFGTAGGRLLMQHYRVDDEFNNSLRVGEDGHLRSLVRAVRAARAGRSVASCWSRPVDRVARWWRAC